jgi:hypothetical protein
MNIIRALSINMTVAQFNALDGNNDQNLNPQMNIQQDPLFVDPANGDFSLQPGSPAIGAGLTPLSTRDKAGNLWNDPPGIGPYEDELSTLTINFPESEDKIKVYPNPAREFFRITVYEPDFKPASFRIIDSSGRIIYQDLLDQGVATVQIPSQFRAGVYIINVLSRGLPLYSKRLIITDR